MNLVDEEHVARLERREYAGQVAGLVEHRAARELEAHAQFVGYDIAQSGLAQSGRPVQERVVERFTAILGGLDKHLEVFHHLHLSAEIGEAQGAQSVLEIALALRSFISYVEIVFHCSFLFQIANLHKS